MGGRPGAGRVQANQWHLRPIFGPVSGVWAQEIIDKFLTTLVRLKLSMIPTPTLPIFGPVSGVWEGEMLCIFGIFRFRRFPHGWGGGRMA